MMDNLTSPDPARQELALKYESTLRRLTLAEWLLTGAVLLAILFSGVLTRLGTVLNSPQPWIISVYFILLMIVLGIIAAPFTYYSDFILARRFGLSRLSFKSWVIDKLKAGVLGFMLGLVVVIFTYWMLGLFPQTWWLWSGIFLILLMIVLARITPTLLVSLFFKLEPLHDSELEMKLKKLVERAGTTVLGIFTIDLSSKATTANAMLAGLGKTRRIILTDTLLQQYSPGEIEVILAHELAHQIHKDIIKMILLQAFVILLGLYLAHVALTGTIEFFGYPSIDSPATLPLLLIILAVYNLIMTPFLNAFSRHMESQADATAIELSADAPAFISAMARLVDQNLSVAAPEKWIELLFYSHPPYNKRVKLAADYLKRNRGANQ
jgi:STE24 endopeptidase